MMTGVMLLPMESKTALTHFLISLHWRKKRESMDLAMYLFMLLSVYAANRVVGGIFSNLPNLIQITLYENQLQSISTGAFGHMTLKELWLYDNQLTHLEDNVFTNLTHLQLLVLSRNRISSISAGAFSGMTELGEVSLHTNRLTSFEEGTFTGLSKLVNISLQNNQIRSLPGKLFHGLPALRKLDLHNNSLPNVPQELLESLVMAEKLILTQNPLRCDRDILPLRDWIRRYPSKVLNSSPLLCLLPAPLRNTKIANLTDEDVMPLTTQSLTTIISTSTHALVTPTEMRRKPHTPPPKKSTPATPAVPANTISPTKQDNSGADGNEEHLSRNTVLITCALICTAVIASAIICVCWRRRKRSSSDLHQQAKNSSVI
ncbi:hypothetical protein MATL_G00031620 [Megalops atlanticus]|uniref:Uncharacterized protein n=1 Tax=Megalops atlanticus TaxID=7932 RepID=A0A9D3QE84_MEGAT|nr:hypothetical protein MATL_G00031620 [Megalops atlanticus]